MAENLPYRPHDIMAWDSSTTVQRMNFANRGVYHSVLDMQWKDGFVDADPLEIKATIRCSDSEWDGFEKHFEKCFPLCEDGKRRNPKCVLMREKAIVRVQKNRENGKLGGRPSPRNEEPNGKPNGKPNDNQSVPDGLSEGEPNEKQSKSKSDLELDKSNSADGEPTAKKPRKKRPPKPKGPPTPQQIRFQKIWDTLSALYEKKGWGQVMSADVNRYITKGVSGLGELLDWLESAKEAGKHDQDCQGAAVQMYLKSELEFDGKTSWEAVFNHRGKLWNQITGVSTAANNPYTEGTRYQRSGEAAS